MPDDDPVRVYLEAALRIAVQRERARLDTDRSHPDAGLRADAEAMRPIIALLKQLADLCEGTPGLIISAAPEGHIAAVTGTDRRGTHGLTIRPSVMGGFRLEESGPTAPKGYDASKLVPAPIDAVLRVVEFVAGHTESVRRFPPAEELPLKAS